MISSERRNLISDIIRNNEIRVQKELVALMQERGVECTQATVSRDLAELNINKSRGIYALPPTLLYHEGWQTAVLTHGIECKPAGDSLLVLRTESGAGQAVAVAVDKAGLSTIVGTVAGDDTIFIAVKNQEDQQELLKQVNHVLKDSSRLKLRQ